MLDDECFFGCDEYDDLKQAIEDYRRRNPERPLRSRVLRQPCSSSNCPSMLQITDTHQHLFDLCIRTAELPDAVELCRQVPETTFILDHCGNPDPCIVNGERQPDSSSPDTTLLPHENKLA